MLADGARLTDTPTVATAGKTAPSTISVYEIGGLASVVASETNVGVALPVIVPSAGVWRANAAGAVVSMTIVRVGDASVESPAASVARTVQVWVPSGIAAFGTNVIVPKPGACDAAWTRPSTMSA